jgi:hypothetical protein
MNQHQVDSLRNAFKLSSLPQTKRHWRGFKKFFNRIPRNKRHKEVYDTQNSY